MGILSRTKDRVVEQMALAYLNNTLLKPYGQATRMQIDSTAKTIAIHFELKGETTPLEIEITDYQIRQDGARYFAEVKGIRTSREWLTALAADRLCNVPFELPNDVGRLLAQAL